MIINSNKQINMSRFNYLSQLTADITIACSVKKDIILCIFKFLTKYLVIIWKNENAQSSYYPTWCPPGGNLFLKNNELTYF